MQSPVTPQIIFSRRTLIVTVFTILLIISMEMYGIFKTSSSQTLGNQDVLQSNNCIRGSIKFEIEHYVKINGYPLESHTMLTHDGYYITAHRIPYGKDGLPNGTRPIAFLQHGLFYTSAAWVISGPENSLAFILADSGFDVWMGNFRGNVYSQAHIKLPINSTKYWDFSLHQLGQYDLPTMIDYALLVNGNEKLMYIGHATGANIFYIMCSINPEYNSKIEAQFSLAPDDILNPNKFLIYHWMYLLQSNEENKLGFISKIECGVNDVIFQSETLCFYRQDNKVCMYMPFLIGSDQIENIDEVTMDMIMATFPAETSMKAMRHYFLCVITGSYTEYNEVEFQTIMNSNPPQQTLPKYDIALVEVPVYLYHGEYDFISTEKEVMELYNIFSNAKGKYKVQSDKFNHIDFLWNKNVSNLLYVQLVKDMTSVI